MMLAKIFILIKKRKLIVFSQYKNTFSYNYMNTELLFFKICVSLCLYVYVLERGYNY